MSITDTAAEFFEACETGKGWQGCAQYCHEGAGFSAQAEALADVTTLEAYTEWMQGLLVLMPDGTYDLKSFATDEDRNSVLAFATFSGTHTGEGGPVPPTGRRASADYVYAMQFDGDKISSMTKVWHSGLTMQELGWV